MPVRSLTECKQVDAELDRQFESPAPGLSEEALRHLDECRRCRDLHDWISDRTPAIEPSPELTRQIATTLAASLRPVKPLPTVGVSVLRFVVVFAAFAPVSYTHLTLPTILRV